MNKKFYVIIISIAIIIGIIVFINNKNPKKYEYTVEKLSEQNYFLVLENNKYGVIDRSGKKIIDPIYDIVEIPNPQKDIFVCKSNYNTNTKEYQTHVFNSKGDTILYQFYIVEAIGLKDVEDNGFYEKSVLKYKSEGLYGLTDFDGNKITKAEYETIEGFEYNEGLLLVKKAGKYGIININGTEIVKEKYDEIHSDGYYTEQYGYKNSGYVVGIRSDDGMRYGYIDNNRNSLLKNEYNDIYRIEKKSSSDDIFLIASKNGKTGVYNNKKIVINHDFEDITYNADNDLFIVQKASKLGVVNVDGSILVPIEYDNVFFAGNYINAQKTDKIDIFDCNGNKEVNADYVSKHSYNNNKYEIVSTAQGEYKIIVPENSKVIGDDYTYIQYLFENYFIVKKDELFGIVNDKGELVVDIKYDTIQPIQNYKIAELIDSQKNIIIINNKMEEIVHKGRYGLIDNKKYLKIFNSKEVIYVNNNGEKTENHAIYPNNRLYTYTENGKWGFKSKDGEVIVKAQYEFASEFNEYGFAAIRANSMWGSIDINGNIVKEPTYEADQEPDFIGGYYCVDLGYGEPYYTN